MAFLLYWGPGCTGTFPGGPHDLLPQQRHGDFQRLGAPAVASSLWPRAGRLPFAPPGLRSSLVCPALSLHELHLWPSWPLASCDVWPAVLRWGESGRRVSVPTATLSHCGTSGSSTTGHSPGRWPCVEPPSPGPRLPPGLRTGTAPQRQQPQSPARSHTLAGFSGSCPPGSAWRLFTYLLLPPGAPTDATCTSKPRKERDMQLLPQDSLGAVPPGGRGLCLLPGSLDTVSFRVFLRKRTEALNKGTPLAFKIDLVKQRDFQQVLSQEAFHRIYRCQKRHGSCF